MVDRRAKLDPLVPSRADYRFLRRLLSSSYGDKIEHRVSEYEAVCSVFLRAGGSWEKLFLGSTKDISLLKSILRVAYKIGCLTKSETWK